ncbi:reverse transcriptase domain-containing protein [Tanacetum coccineum]
MHTRASNSELVEPRPEPERTLNRRLRRRNRRVPFEQRNKPPAQPKVVYAPILNINHFRHLFDILENYNPIDDKPMWDADRVVAPTPGSVITIPKTVNEFAIKDTENEVVRLMMFPLSLTGEAKTWLDELNEGTIKTWDELQTDFISRLFPPVLFDRLLGEIGAFSQHENETLTEAWLRMKEVLRNCHGHNLSKGNIIKTFYHGLNETTKEVLNATAGVFTLSGKCYDPPINPNDQQNDFKTPIIFDSEDEDEEPTPQPKPNIMYPQRLRKEKMEAQYGKFLDMIRVIQINVPLVDFLAGMSNYGKFLKELISNKHKLEQITSSFLCDKIFSCDALADLGASINIMPYSLYAKLSLETLKPTKMSVRLADRSFQYPVGIAENMLVEVVKFIFPVDFVILEMEEDSKVPLISGRPFLHTADAVIRVK